MPVITSGYGTLGSVLFGQPNSNTVNYFEQIKEKINQKAGVYTDEFLKTSNQIFDSLYSSRALELARAAINKAGSLFDPDIIRQLTTIDEFQTAKSIMQRFIMANPVVRQMWFDNRCDGYSDTYIDHEQGLIGEDHYDYKMVMDGSLKFNEETQEYYFRDFKQDYREGDIDLTVHEKMTIMDSWNNINAIMALAGKDPTSAWNSDLQ